MHSRTLTIVASLAAVNTADGKVVVTGKFVEGILQYCKFWDGPVRVVMPEAKTPENNLDNLAVRRDELPFRLDVVPGEQLNAQGLFDADAVVMASLDDFQQSKISSVCRAAGIPCVYVSEYSLKTRKQIIAATTPNPLRKLRRNLWVTMQEKKNRRAVRLADGLQCNGTPTYDAYRSLSRDSLLFFDNRVREDLVATEDEVVRRTDGLTDNNPLRLVFSGRLIKIKGADHLIDVAQALRSRGVAFRMAICGDGDLVNELRSRIDKHGLSDYVSLLGVLPFETGLLPFVKAQTDLFVCCHRQGDPSCTYLETMFCGVPIVGYANEAFAGVVKRFDVGWIVNMDRPDEMAGKIAEINNNRLELRAMSRKLLPIFAKHTFENTFRARIEHLHGVCDRKEAASAQSR